MQTIEIVSTPPGARVLVDGRPAGTTPTSVIVRRRDPRIVVRLERDGFVAAETVLRRSANGWLAGNLAFALYAVHPDGFGDNPESRAQKIGIGFGLSAAAFAVDFANGSAFTHQARLSVTLQPIPPVDQEAWHAFLASHAPSLTRR